MERVQKILASAGIGSRRNCEELIKAGKVSVNGKKIKLGDKAKETDKIRVDGNKVEKEKKAYIILYKPRGYVTTVKETHDMKTIMELVKVPQRVYPAGRLDKDAEGLLLLTNDGELMQKITHPKHLIEKKYKVVLDRPLSKEGLQKINKGIIIEGREVKARCVSKAKEATITIHEGRKHIVKKIFISQGYIVNRLFRESIGPISIGKLSKGKWRYLREDELKHLRQSLFK